MQKNAITSIISITACAPFCSEIPADGNNRDKRRKPNPLRLTGRFQFPGPSIRSSEYPSQSVPISLAPQVPSPFKRPLSFSFVRNASDRQMLSLSLFLSHSAPFLFRSDRSVDGAPRTEGDAAYIYHFTSPAGFTDTLQEQMNASHFDGFMNTLGEDGERGERIRCFRRSLLYCMDQLILFLPRSSRQGPLSLSLRSSGTETESP